MENKIKYIDTDFVTGDSKIKRERIDPEIEGKVSANCANASKNFFKDELSCRTAYWSNEYSAVDSYSNNENMNADEKKGIEPVKSSNEILAELFKVFNATPPGNVLNNKSLLEKVKHKKHKKEKKKKEKKSRSNGRMTSDEIDTESNSTASSVFSKEKSCKTKHNKSRRHKHKSEKVRRYGRSETKRSSTKRTEESDIFRSRINKDSPNDLSSEHSEDLSPKSRKQPNFYDSRIISSKTGHSDVLRRFESNLETRPSNSFYRGFSETICESKSEWDRRIKSEKPDTDAGKKTVRESSNQYSDTSLSDEESTLDYYKYRSNRPSLDSRRFGSSSHHVFQSRDYHYKQPNTFYHGVDRTSQAHNRERHRNNYRYRRCSRSRTRTRSRSRWRSRSRSRSRVRSRTRTCSRSRTRSRTRLRSRSRSHDLGIDKKRLLEIARKNAISMFKRGNLPGCAGMSDEIKDKVLLKMRYGGRTVKDLTDFCKKLSNGENFNDISDLSSEEESDVDKSGNLKAFNHPFMIKEKEPIVFDIRGSKPKIPDKCQDDTRKIVTMQFPVSSGQQHRLNEAWVPVEPKDALAPLPALPTATQSTTIFKKLALKNVFEKPMPIQTEQEPAFKQVNKISSTIVDACKDVLPKPPSFVPKPENNEPPSDGNLESLSSCSVKANQSSASSTRDKPQFVPDVPIPSTAQNSSIFPPVTTTNLDVSSIISKRLSAMRRLQDNPMDSEALKMMHSSQQEMASWACSKHLPGQFTGSTGANTLSVRELNSGPQAWARRDQLTSTLPVTGGMGMQILQKMGWRPGEGLGREKSGSLQPLLLDVKLDKRGLISQGDSGYQPRQSSYKKRRGGMKQIEEDITNKHPVCLLNEIASKRKWTPPLYTLVNEGGPGHNKVFYFSVSINGQTFTPNEGANTKKDAKVKAARFCLKQMGIMT